MAIDTPERQVSPVLQAAPQGRTHRVTAHARKSFIETLRQTGNVAEACRRSGFSRKHAYRMRGKNPAFAAAWLEAEEIAADALELEAWRRAVEGVPKPLVSMGKLVLGADGKPIEMREYSDHLMITLLKARRPERFRENINVSGTVTHELSARLDEAIQRLKTKTIDVAPDSEVMAVPALKHKT